MKKRELTIPTILGILFLIVGMGAGIWFLREPIKSAVFAYSEEIPNQVQITNVSDTSFVVSWLTDKAAAGFIQYGQSTNPNLVIADDRDQERGTADKYFTHFVSVRGLKPSTRYYFRIGADKSLYDTTTGLSLGSPPAADIAYGQILTGNGEPADGAIVYLTLAGAVPQASLVKSSGSWVIPLSTARSVDLTSFVAYDPKSSQVQIRVQAGPLGQASVITTTDQDSPVAAISLGQNLNLLASQPQPPEAHTSSRFSTSSLIIISPKTGEQVNSAQPEIIGRGPANSEVTITVNSPTSITNTIQTDSNGEFSYSVPKKLPPGEHTITISTLINGVAKQVQRKFIVLAAGESQIPAFTATPSATLRPSPSPTIKPRITMPATESGVPTSGNLTPTLVLLILGSALTISGVVTYKKFV